jgi:REP element-mobilizing transposase RayT
LNVHFIFTTKNRTRLLPDTIRPSLHAYMATVLQISAERHVWD